MLSFFVRSSDEKILNLENFGRLDLEAVIKISLKKLNPVNFKVLMRKMFKIS
jgi:hypothetical protein